MYVNTRARELSASSEQIMPIPGEELSALNFESMIGGPLCAMVVAQTEAAKTTVDFIRDVGFEPAANGGADYTKPVYVNFGYTKEGIGPYKISVGVTNGGSGYSAAPTVTFTGGGGTDATATATLDEGKVKSVTMTSQGTGYTSAPEVSLSGGQGTGATLSVTYTPGQPGLQDMVLKVPLLSLVPIPYIRIKRGEINFHCRINSFSYENSAKSTNLGGELGVGFGWGRGRVRLNVSASEQRTSNAGSAYAQTYTMGVKVVAVQDEIPAGLDRVLGMLEASIVPQPAAVLTTTNTG